MLPAGKRYFFGVAMSSLNHQSLTSTAAAFGLKSSMRSPPGCVEFASTSLMKMAGVGGAGSSAPGEPPAFVLARQLFALLGEAMAFAFTGTSEGPLPSGVIGHGAESSHVTLKTVRFAASLSVSVSPLFERLDPAPHAPSSATAGYFAANCAAFRAITLNCPDAIVAPSGNE